MVPWTDPALEICLQCQAVQRVRWEWGLGGGCWEVGRTEWAADSWQEPPPTCGHMPHFCLCPWQAGVGVRSLTEDSKCSEPKLPTGNEGHRLVREGV